MTRPHFYTRDEHDARVTELLQANNREVERRRKATSALRAIIARVDGAFDDPDLVAFGPLSLRDDDVLRMAEEGLSR